MSGLAAVLAGRVEPGVYRWHAAYDVADVRHTVERAGWRFAHLDGWSLATKAELLDALGAALNFPDHYGRNLDALADCLTDLEAGTVLLWDGWSPLARDDQRTFAVVVELLRAAALAVLLRGDGPEVEIPSLD